MAPFVGEERHALVDALMDRLDALQAGEGVAGVVVLEAESGAGKSRIVRELYDRLRRKETESDTPAYWPALDEPRRTLSPGADPLPARKIVGPATSGFVWPANAVPGFAWLALSCQQLASGDAIRITADFDDWVTVHGDALWWAWNLRAGNLEKVASKRDALLERAREAVQESGVEAAGRMLTELGVPTMGLGWLLTQSGKVWNAGVERRRRVDALGRDVTAQASTGSKAQEIAGKLKAVARPDLPVVVVVEDAHLLGGDLAELLTVLAQPDPTHPVLVVATAWPEGRMQPVWAGWLSRNSARGTADVWPLGRLPDDDLITLLRAYAPNTSDEIAGQVVARWANPLALELLLTWSPVAEHIAGNDRALTYTADQLWDMPTGVLELFAARWGTLPRLMRQLLAASRAILPSENGTEPFLRSVIASAAVNAELVDVWAGDIDTMLVEGQLGQAREMLWLKESESAEAFTEASLADVAFDRISAELGRRALSTVIPALSKAVATELAERIWQANEDFDQTPTSDPSLRVAYDWLLDLAEAGSVEGLDALALTLASLDRAHREAAVYHYRQAVTLTQNALTQSPLPPDHPAMLAARDALARWLGESGQLDEAITVSRALVDEAIRLLGHDHPLTLGNRNNLAIWLQKSGRVNEAIAESRAVLDERSRVLGRDHPDTLASRGNLAIWLGDSGRVGEAITQQRAVLDDQTRVLGPANPDTLNTRANLAFSLGESGQVDEAITQLRAVLDDQSRVLGPDNPDTLNTRANLALWLGNAGQVDEAVTQVRALLDDQIRVLGPDHPDTLTTRGNLGIWMGRSGRVGEATSVLRAVLDEQTRVLGPDHPDTLTTRADLARWLGESGRLHEAISVLRAVLDDRTRVLGPDHPDTLTTRGKFARFLGQSGEVYEAITQYRTLLDDHTRVLGPEHPDTLTTRSNLAHFFGVSGRVDEAITELRAVLEVRTRVLGPEHPDTLTTRGSLALRLGDSGQVDEAITELRAVLEARTRVLGPDHPDTLKTRGALAAQLAMSGRLDEASTQLQAVLDVQLRLLGADHPDTLTTRMQLATQLGLSGQGDDSITQLQTVLDVQLRLLGADNPGTLATRGDLAHQLGLSGQGDEAITQLKDLLDDQLRVLGADHHDILAVRAELAYWLGDSGQVDEAITQLQAVVDVQMRELGADHPDTLTTRGELAYQLGLSGQADEAVRELRVLLDDQTRVLGTHHADALDTRADLALWLGLSGHVDEAMAHCRVVLDERTRVLGSAHPKTQLAHQLMALVSGDGSGPDAGAS